LICAVACLAACASQSPMAVPTTPSDEGCDLPPTDVSHDLLASEVASAFASFLNREANYTVFSHTIEVLSTVRFGEFAFSMARVDLKSGTVFLVPFLQREEGRWQVNSYHELRLNEAIAPRTNKFSLNTSRAYPFPDTYCALNGFVDPTVTRVETVGLDGNVFDGGLPIGGAYVVLQPSWGLIRLYRNTVLVNAVPIIGDSSVSAPTDELDDQAKHVSDAFVRIILSEEVGDAGQFVSPEAGLDKYLPLFIEVLRSLGARLDQGSGLPTAAKGVLSYGLRTSTGPGNLFVSLARDDQGWRVFTLAFSSIPDITQ
jgi:hypothetical protein